MRAPASLTALLLLFTALLPSTRADDVIENTLSEMLPEEDLAYQAGLKYTRKLRDSDRYTFFRKLGGFLARRGFSYDVIKPIAARLWDEREENYSNNADALSE